MYLTLKSLKVISKNKDLKNELKSYKVENFLLSQKISNEKEKVQRLIKNNFISSQESEIEDERRFNLERNALTESGKQKRLRSFSLPPTERLLARDHPEILSPTRSRISSVSSYRSMSYNQINSVKEGLLGYKTDDDEHFTTYFFALDENGCLYAYDPDVRSVETSMSIFEINLDSIKSAECDESNNLITLTTKGLVHILKAQDNESMNDWMNWINSLNPFENTFQK